MQIDHLFKIIESLINIRDQLIDAGELHPWAGMGDTIQWIIDHRDVAEKLEGTYGGG